MDKPNFNDFSDDSEFEDVLFEYYSLARVGIDEVDDYVMDSIDINYDDDYSHFTDDEINVLEYSNGRVFDYDPDLDFSRDI